MKLDFPDIVRSAAHAAWWCLLVGAALVYVQYAAYLYAVRAHPAWLAAVWGEGLDWAFIQRVWLVTMIAFKIMVGAILLAAIWLTLWSRGLAVKRGAGARPRTPAVANRDILPT